MSEPRVLIVDDEPDIRELLEITLGRMNLITRAAENVAQAKTLLEGEAFDLCLTDMNLPDGSGMEIVKLIGERHPQTPVAMITAHGSMDSAIDAIATAIWNQNRTRLARTSLRSKAFSCIASYRNIRTVVGS